MASMANLFFFSFTLFAAVTLQCHSLLSGADKRTYIVHMKHQDKPSEFATHGDWYAASLRSLSSTSTSSAEDVAGATPPLLYSYSTAYHGFAAALTADQAKALLSSDSVLGVYEDTVYTLHTTRTPEFLGLSTDDGLWDPHTTSPDQPRSDVVVGVLDTGIWPESKSFDDTGMSEVPSRWRGECESGPDFSPKLCNRKLVGARFFSKGFHMASGKVQSWNF